MKKIALFLFVAFFVSTFSSCTKEQSALNLLHGTWKLTSRLDASGQPDLPQTGCTEEELITFFLCDDNDQDDCEVTTKTTTTCTVLGATSTFYDSDRTLYSVFEKSQLVVGGQVFEIETIKKKELVIRPVASPRAVSTYEKQ